MNNKPAINKFIIPKSEYNKLRVNKPETIKKHLEDITKGNHLHFPDNDIVSILMYRIVNTVPISTIKSVLRKIIPHLKVIDTDVYFFVSNRFYKLSFYDFDGLRCTELTHYTYNEHFNADKTDRILTTESSTTYQITNFYTLFPIILNNNETINH